MHPRSEHDGDGPCAACQPDPFEATLAAQRKEIQRLGARVVELERPIPMRLHCPACGSLHIDVEFKDRPHHTHACQHCGMVWRPAIVNTVGVQFLPGFKDEPDG